MSSNQEIIAQLIMTWFYSVAIFRLNLMPLPSKVFANCGNPYCYVAITRAYAIYPRYVMFPI